MSLDSFEALSDFFHNFAPELHTMKPNMKIFDRMKQFFLFLLLLVPASAFAETVDLNRSMQLASGFFTSLGDISPRLNLVQEDNRTKAADDARTYYIYNNMNGGFVIVAADDCVYPIIGYSRDSQLSLDNIPDNMQYWLNMWSGAITDMRAKGLTEPGADYAWTQLLQGKRLNSTKAEASELQLETAKWNQTAPYNNKCPMDGAERSMTGCTATATCIIMRYHKWPDAGVGTLPAYTTSKKGIKVDAITLGETYDWNNMPLEYNGQSTETQNNSVATLMQHVGAMIKSDYAAEGTGAYPSDVVLGIGKYMKYDKSAVRYSAANYSKDEWVGTIKKELNENGPVFYDGLSERGGHAFVMDGYDANDLLHINWGWGGSGDGFYNYPVIGEYTMDNGAIFNFKKDEGGQEPDNISLYSNNGSKGLSLDKDKIEPGTHFTATLKYVANLGNVEFAGYVGLGKFNHNGELDEVCFSTDGQFDPQYVYTVTLPDCVFNSEINIGDYLQPIYKSDRTPEWTALPYDHLVDDFVGRVYLADATTLAQETKINYSKTASTCTITTKSGSSMSLVDASGKEMSSAYSLSDGQMTVDLKALSSGTYTLKLSKGKEYKEISLTFGLK